MTTDPLFTTYQDTYLAIRAKYEHPDEPVLYNGRVYCETLPPKGWDRERYAAYFAEVSCLGDWYAATVRYAARRRKTADDRIAWLALCNRLNIVGASDLRFEGEPAQDVLFS